MWAPHTIDTRMNAKLVHQGQKKTLQALEPSHEEQEVTFYENGASYHPPETMSHAPPQRSP